MGGPALCDGEQHCCMDNFAICRFFINGHEWVSAEQYYQASKFQDQDYKEKIRSWRPRRNMGVRLMASTHGREVWQLGQDKDKARADGFRSLETMYVANRVKFDQNPGMRAAILATGEAPIEAAHSTADWQQWNTWILTCVREELRPSAERDEDLLAVLRHKMTDTGCFDEASAQARVDEAARSFDTFGDQINVKAQTMDGRAHDLYLHARDTVLVAKEQLCVNLGVSAARLSLLQGSKMLEDERSLAEEGIVESCTLTLMVSAPVPRDVQSRNFDLHEALKNAGRLASEEEGNPVRA